MIHVTRDLLTVLLERAAERDPNETNLRLSATRAGDFDADTGLGPETPVVTHFTPDVGGSVNAVFGVDLGTPAGHGGGRFLSHPGGFLGVSKTDDLAAVVLVAVPPYDEESVAAFDRSGDGMELALLDAAPPEESIPE
ncbi:hypothetical protein DJ82_07815 [Halorubrum sp. Ib24]|uniref:hypothetical protein n=1 Tax=unclassified Halorubrum TaxID=2642239 RepID=UPI000B98D5F9|nr:MULTISPECIES: hypothetical protein [unclassified Halorubrum]OYR39497.1 hypothetical protein DJ75_16665 [Halorubrum sp. Eb13]OYR40357.1 hypothetical protein DJ82_07815 [Halorubrum sp. Ib24]OYR50398.1 hypothetical protein DJ73_15940 [Halorubrum sp. Ea1]